jgi:hypothetical protein
LAYDKGILIEGTAGQQVFLGEEFIANFNLLCSFFDLGREGLATSFGGPVRGDEGQPSDRDFLIYYINKDLFVITDNDDDSEGLAVDMKFVQALRSAALLVVIEGSFEEDKEWENWSIHGSFPWTGLAFSINEEALEIYPSDDTAEQQFIFFTERGDRGLWFRSIALAEKMLDKDNGVTDSWQIVSVRGGSDKKMRLELEGERVLFSVHDPSLPNISASIYLDAVTMLALRMMFTEVWVLDEDSVEIEVLYAYDEDDEDDDD